ncbi:hypothetical protein GmHk_01G001568 [Glycine max]|nr:hypothetical protein GmHk_01G001568 [Glycine max]
MDTPPASPPPPLPPPPANADASPSTLKRTRKATRLRSLATRPPGAERPVVNVDPATGKADGPYKKKLRTYLGIVARDKVDVTYDTWKEVPTAQKDLIWEDIQAEFQIPEASDNRTKKKILQIVGERWRQFKSDLTRKWALAVDKDGADDIVCEKYGISKEKWTQFCQTRRDPSWEDVRKKAQASQKQNTAPTYCVAPSGPRVSTKESCVAPSGNNPGMGDSDKCSLYIEENPSRLVALGRLYEGSTTVHNIPLLHGQVKVGVEEVKDTEALVPVPTAEVTLVGQALNTFLAWPTHLVKRLSEQAAVSPAKPPESPDEEVDDPLYLMTLTIPQLFLKPLQVMWDATIFGVFNQNFPLYIKHEDLSEIAHGGQCLSISVIQLWILHLTETSVRAGNSDVYGFLEPQSIQRSGQSQFESESYIKSWIQSSKRDVYLGAYLNSGHWQMVVILPKENLVVWFCSLHNRPDNYLKGIINSALKGLDDTPQPKSKAVARWIVVKCNRQKGITECGYYVMHWMSTIILGSFRNNWETYFNEVRPLEAERFKALRIQWAQYYLKVRNQT